MNTNKSAKSLAASLMAVLFLVAPAAEAIVGPTVQDVRIDTSTGGNWPSAYGDCFALVPQAFPRTQKPEQQVGPRIWTPDRTAFGTIYDPDYANYAGADPNNALLDPPSNVCVSGAGVPVGDPTLYFDFRLFSRSGIAGENAFAWAFLEDNGDAVADPYEVKPGTSQLIPCLGNGDDVFRAGTFDNERFANDPLSGEVVVKEGGDAVIAYYFLTARLACRAQAWRLYWIDPDDTSQTRQTLTTSAARNLPIRDLADGKYLVVELNDIPPGATIGLATSDLTPGAGEICSDPLAVGQAANSHLSGIFIDGTGACAPLLASLGDFVWEDLNGDGKQEDGEPGIGGVTVNLLSPGADGLCASATRDEQFVASATTDNDGAYMFDGLDAGDYCVEFVKPAGYECTLANQGGDNGLDSDVVDMADGTCQTEDPAQNPISLAAGENDPTWDAGLIRPASLGDFVWEDVDRDGIQDGDEPGINGVAVELTDCGQNPVIDASGAPVAPMVTMDRVANDPATAGYYAFTNLRPGCYVVEFVKPAGYVYTTKNAVGSTPANDSNALASGFTDPVDLASGDDDPTIDAGLYLAQGLGDFVWHDLNSNGIQEANEPGIQGVRVDLFNFVGGACVPMDIPIATTTDANGEYFFATAPGNYCVGFTKPADFCHFGPAMFTTRGAGGDAAKDSDADPDTGLTGVITLPANITDTSWDAGIYCPAKLGDRLWDDLNQNGVQDSGEPGIPGQTVKLLTCSGEELETTTTGADGIYMFVVDPSRDYVVEFGAPGGTLFTLQDNGDNNAVDSDVAADGRTDCITDIVSDTYDDSWDAGVIPVPECGLAVSKSCEVLQPITGSFTCDSKLDAITMVWDVPGTLTGVTAYAGAIGSTVLPATIDGDEVTVSGYRAAGAPNDVIWVYTYTDAGGTQTGQSKFHLSCSDDEMDGPEDCGLPEGDGKSNDSAYTNAWLLEGLVTEKGTTLDCTPSAPVANDSCEIQAVLASCETTGKPVSLTFQYTGGGCAASDNTQDPTKATCSGGVDGTAISVIADNSSSPVADGDYLVDPTSVALNGAFTVSSGDGGTFDSQTYYKLIDENGHEEVIGIHTSCSQPLAAGDVFGSLRLVAINGVGLGKDVLYSYLVSNDGDAPITGITVEDDVLGSVDGSPIDALAPGESALLTETAFVASTTTNTVLVSGEALGAPGLTCEAQDQSTVAVLDPPPCDVSIAFDKLEDNKIKWKLTNTGNRLATLDTLTLTWPVAQGYVKKVKLDGDIFVGMLEWTPAGATISAGDWVANELDRRQLSPGEQRTLEIEFSVKYTGDTPDDYTLLGTFEEGCTVSFTGLPPALSCADGDPTALVFDYTGAECSATTNTQEGKFVCSETGMLLGGLSSVVMTTNETKFDVTYPAANQVRIEYIDNPGDAMPSEIKYEIEAANDETQSHVLHTSCSKPLAVGDRFGAFTLKEFFPKY